VILSLIQAIRHSAGKITIRNQRTIWYAEFIFTNGGCYRLYKILKTAFPEAIPCYFGYEDTLIEHVVTKIKGRYYDITGEIEDIKAYGEEMYNGREFHEGMSEKAKSIAIRRCSYDHRYGFQG